MTDYEILTAVKAAIGISGTALDSRLLLNVKAVKNLMSNYGIDTEELESDLGIQAIALGVQDLMNGTPGEVKLSEATKIFLGQLHHQCLPELDE